MKALVIAVLVAMTAHAEARWPKDVPDKAPLGSIAVIDRPVAMVGGKQLWESEVDERMFGREKADRPKLVEELIDDMLFLRRAGELGITSDDEEAKRAFDEVKSQNNLDDAGIDRLLAEQGFTRVRYLRELKRQLVILRVKNAEIRAAAKETDDLEKLTAAWIAKQRKRVHIERWP